MSKYCPEIECDFWDDFPDGLPGKKLKKCPFCQNDLITEKPVNPRQQEVEEIFEDPIGEADDNIMEHVSKEITDTYTIIEQPSLHSSSAKVQFLKNTESSTSFEEITTLTTRDISDKNKSDSNPTIGAESQPSDGERNDVSDESKSNPNPTIGAESQPSDGERNDISDKSKSNPNPTIGAESQPSDGERNDISDKSKSNPNPTIGAESQPSDGERNDVSDKSKSNPNPTIGAKAQPSDGEREDISGKSKPVSSRRDPLVRVSDQMQTRSANNFHSININPNPGKNKRSNEQRSEADDRESEVRKNKKIEQKEDAESQHAPLSECTILSEIDPKVTEYVNIQFDTLILKEYWNKIDAICLRIGGKYFGDFKTSVVPFSKTGEVKLKGCEFVTITGILKFPLKLISANEIRFSYKYYVYSNDKKKSYEHLHHYSGADFNRYFIWNIEKPPIALMNSTYLVVLIWAC